MLVSLLEMQDETGGKYLHAPGFETWPANLLNNSMCKSWQILYKLWKFCTINYRVFVLQKQHAITTMLLLQCYYYFRGRTFIATLRQQILTTILVHYKLLTSDYHCYSSIAVLQGM